MPKLTSECREAMRSEFLSRKHMAYVRGEIITNNLLKIPRPVSEYVNFLEDNFVKVEEPTEMSDGVEMIKFSSLREMAAYIYGKPLTRWQMNQLERWEKSRRKVCPDVVLVVDAAEEEPDETEELREKVKTLESMLRERQAACVKYSEEVKEAHRKLRRVKLIANLSEEEER